MLHENYWLEQIIAGNLASSIGSLVWRLFMPWEIQWKSRISTWNDNRKIVQEDYYALGTDLDCSLKYLWWESQLFKSGVTLLASVGLRHGPVTFKSADNRYKGDTAWRLRHIRKMCSLMQLFLGLLMAVIIKKQRQRVRRVQIVCGSLTWFHQQNADQYFCLFGT